jgi:hypothetical protein
MFAAALEINANHFQMTYYLLIFLLILSFIYKIKSTSINHFKLFWRFGYCRNCTIGTNATSLLATAEYTSFSTRQVN